jgi:hypothetical protein
VQLPYRDNNSWIVRLSAVVHGDGARGIFGMFKFYADETGIQFKDRYCTIAGYVGDIQQWDGVEHDWNFVLDEFKVPLDDSGLRYFHALEFYGSGKKYRNWSKSKRRAFFDALADCLRDHEVRVLASSIDVQIFNSLTEDERHYVTGGFHNGMKWKYPGAPSKAYFLPFHNVLQQATKFVPRGTLMYPIMSRQDQYEMKALELYERMLNGYPAPRCRAKWADDMIFSNPKKVAQLQAADLAAYWLGQFMKYLAQTGDKTAKDFPNKYEFLRIMERLQSKADFKLFDFQGLMLLLQGSNRYIKTSFPGLDQSLPSLPVAERKRILSVMRKADLRKFADQWTPTAQAGHDQTEIAPADHTEPVLLRWLERPFQPGFS